MSSEPKSIELHELHRKCRGVVSAIDNLERTEVAISDQLSYDGYSEETKRLFGDCSVPENVSEVIGRRLRGDRESILKEALVDAKAKLDTKVAELRSYIAESNKS